MTTHLHHLQHHHHHSRRAIDLRIPAIEKYAYCLCLHVKPTTIFIAVFKLIRALLFASLLLNTEFAINEQGQEVSLASLEDRHNSTAAAMSILSRFIMASVSAVGIYAVVSGRAALLMPLYAMLLCDFFFSLPTFYSREIEFADGNGFSDLRQPHHGLGGVNGVIGSGGAHTQYTRYSIILFSTITMIIKIYFLCVVWKCYRYLRLSELISPIGLSEIYPHLPPAGYPVVRVLGSLDSTDLSSSQMSAGQGQNVTPPPYETVASTMKPPNYEEAIKSSGQVSTIDNTQQANHNQQQPRQQQTVVFTVLEDSTSIQVVTSGNSQLISNVTPNGATNDPSEHQQQQEQQQQQQQPELTVVSTGGNSDNGTQRSS